MKSSSIILLVSFALMAMYTMVQLGVLIGQGHKFLHYSAVFHAMASLWMLLRVIFWLMDVADLEGNQLLTDLVFWFPQSAMFLTFATLALFLLRVVSRPSWHTTRTRYLFVFGVTAAANLAGTATLAILDSHYASVADSGAQNIIQNIQSAANSVLFCILAAVFGWIGRSLLVIGSWDYTSMFLFSPRTTSLVVWVLACIFVSRSVFNLVTALGLVDIDTNDESVTTGIEEVGLYVIWELTPLGLLLATIASGRRGARPSAAAPGKDVVSFGVFGAISEMEEQYGAASFDGIDDLGAVSDLVHDPGSASAAISSDAGGGGGIAFSGDGSMGGDDDSRSALWPMYGTSRGAASGRGGVTPLKSTPSSSSSAATLLGGRDGYAAVSSSNSINSGVGNGAWGDGGGGNVAPSPLSYLGGASGASSLPTSSSASSLASYGAAASGGGLGVSGGLVTPKRMMMGHGGDASKSRFMGGGGGSSGGLFGGRAGGGSGGLVRQQPSFRHGAKSGYGPLGTVYDNNEDGEEEEEGAAAASAAVSTSATAVAQQSRQASEQPVSYLHATAAGAGPGVREPPSHLYNSHDFMFPQQGATFAPSAAAVANAPPDDINRGFLQAQQNAVRRSAYIAPKI